MRNPPVEIRMGIVIERESKPNPNGACFVYLLYHYYGKIGGSM